MLSSLQSESLDHDTVSTCRKATAGVVQRPSRLDGCLNRQILPLMGLPGWNFERPLAEGNSENGGKKCEGVSAGSRSAGSRPEFER